MPYLTEAEARQKTCHKTLATVVPTVGPPICMPHGCIASECMAWRWKNASDGALAANRLGFCGYAGEPRR